MNPFKIAAQTLLSEFAAARSEFFDSLSEIWSPVLSFGWWWHVWFQGGPASDLTRRMVRTLGVWQEFREDSSLAPARALRSVASAAIPVPPGWDTRVMTAGDALRWLVETFIDSAIDVVDADLPAEVDLALDANKLPKGAEVVQYVRAGEIEAAAPAARRIAGGVVAAVAVQFASYAGASSVLLMAALFLERMHGPEGSAVLRKYALQQENPRRTVDGVHVTRKEVTL